MKTRKPTTKQLMKTGAYRVAAKLVSEYAGRFVVARGFFPTITVGIAPDLRGYPVRNPMGGENIAFFATKEAADAAILAARREQAA